MKNKLGLAFICIVSFFLFVGCKSNTTSELENINQIVSWLEEELPNMTREDLVLPSTHPTLGGEITWTSVDPLIISNTGKIVDSNSNEEAMLEYKIVLGKHVRTNFLEVFVVSKTIDDAADEFSSQFAAIIARDYNLKTSFFDAYTVTWESSDEEVFSNEGVFTSPFNATTITISYTVTAINPIESKSYTLDLPAYRMRGDTRKQYILERLDSYFDGKTVLDKTKTLPTDIGINGTILEWYDANNNKVNSLEEVTTYIIPNVGVDLTVKVVTQDEPFNVMCRYQTEESNAQALMRKITSVDLVKEMKVGWCLGNTFDSPSETAWSNPVTTKKMIDKVKEAGFNVLRIPVTWEGHFNTSDPYTIDEAWISRYQEVINYAIDDKTFVILNMHHERWNSTSYANQERASLLMEKLWTQIGERFACYDEHLIFEGMNEPRIYEASDSIQWSGCEEAFTVINHLNQVFVNTIRSLGGNNSYRHLLVTTNGAGTSEAIISNLTVPEDPYVIVSVHAYAPYDFAHDKTETTTWSKDNYSDTSPIDGVFERINNYFLKEGIAVIMGEFATRDKNNLASRLEWLEYYLTKATALGVPCLWWDTGQVQTPENMTFSIFNRVTSTWLFPEIVEALMEYS